MSEVKVSEDGLYDLHPDGRAQRRYVPDGQVLVDFLSDRQSRAKIIQGPIGSGKTLAMFMDIWLTAQAQHPQRDGVRRCRAHIFRDTFNKLKDTTIKSWLAWFPEKDYGRFFNSVPIHHDIRLPGLELDVHFVALEDEWKGDYFRSLETTVCGFNEVQYMARALFDEATSRVGRYPQKIDGGAVYPHTVADMNAPDETHWVPIMRGDVAMPDYFTEEQIRAHRKPKSWRFFTQPAGLLEVKGQGDTIEYELNPNAENIKFLEDGYYLHVIEGKGKSWIDANVLNRVSPRRDGKPVLRDFNRAVHVAKQKIEPIPGVKIVIGCDFGRRPCAIFAQYLRGTWYVLHELVTRDMGADQFAPLLKNEIAQKFPRFPFQIWGDPSGDFKGQNDNSVPYQIFRTHGLPVQPAPSILFSVRLQAMEATLTRMLEGKPALLVSPSCNILVAALDGGWHYRRIKVSGEKYAEEPEKDEYSDPADALGYLLLGGGEGQRLLLGSDKPPAVIKTVSKYNPFQRHRERRSAGAWR